MKLRFYVDEIKHILKNSDLDSRFIVQLIQDQRALWLKNEYNKLRTIEGNVYQSFDQTFDLIPQNNIIPTNGVMLRSTTKIPRPLELVDTLLINLQEPDFMSKTFEYCGYKDIKYKGNGRFNRNTYYFTFLDDYLYIKVLTSNQSLLEYCKVTMVAERPTDVYDKLLILNYLDEEFPLPVATWNYIKEQILRIDTINNAKQEVENVL